MITAWPSLYRPAEGRVVQDAALFARAKAPRSHERKEDVPRWAGGEFRGGYRSLANFLCASMLVYDFDAGANREQIAEAFGDTYGVAHVTWTPGRWRVALVLSRSVVLEEHERCWRAGAAHAERCGLVPDYAARSGAHCFALPARHEGDAYDFMDLTGAFFDVDDALAAIPKAQPLPPTERRSGIDDSYSRRLERAGKYLAAMPGAISGSGGHATTFKAACVLVRGFALEPDDALALLVEIHNPNCSPHWNERELRHKIKQAFQRSQLPFGFLADRGRAA